MAKIPRPGDAMVFYSQKQEQASAVSSSI